MSAVSLPVLCYAYHWQQLVYEDKHSVSFHELGSTVDSPAVSVAVVLAHSEIHYSAQVVLTLNEKLILHGIALTKAESLSRQMQPLTAGELGSRTALTRSGKCNEDNSTNARRYVPVVVTQYRRQFGLAVKCNRTIAVDCCLSTSHRTLQR